jgi:hypothetical protein
MDTEEQIPGQMDIEECIEIASTGADGKASNVGQPSRATERRLTVKEIVQARLTKGAQ